MRGYADTDPLLGGRRRSKSCQRNLLILTVLLGVLLVVFVVLFAYFYIQYSHEQNDKPPEWQVGHDSSQTLETYPLNAIAADASVCSTIGSYVLNVQGGNAMDAAVASILCVGVCNSHSAGIGGGSFMLHYDSNSGSVSAFDYRETAPAAASTNMFNKLPQNSSMFGGLAVAVPGEVKGLATAHLRFGRLPWATVVRPVAELLRSGLHVAEPLADAMRMMLPAVPDSPPYKTLRDWMLNPSTEKPYAFGDLLKDEKLAATMEKIAEDPFSFYNGSLAETIVREVADAGGNLTLEDLREYAVSEPQIMNVSLDAAKMRLLSMPPPCSGPVLAFIMKLVDGFGPTPAVKERLDDYVTFLHRFVESLKFGYAKRSALGDPDFVNVTQLVANLTSAAFADEVRKRITDDATHDVNYYGPSFDWNPDSGTTHLSVVDSDGNAVAVTSTINTYFGSLIKGPETGILYNNEMDDFSVPNRTNSFGVPPSPSNFIQPGKRPFSSMVPAMLTDLQGNLKLVTGGAGGTRITTAVAYTLARQLYFNETVKEATDAFRLHHQLVPNYIQYNPEVSFIPAEVMDGLKKKGHKFHEASAISVVEAIERLKDDAWQASGDFRKPSKPDGN